MRDDEKIAARGQEEKKSTAISPVSTSEQPADQISPVMTSREEKMGIEQEEEPEIAQIVHAIEEGQPVTAEQHQRVAAHYGRRAETDHLAPSSDVEYILDQIVGMSEAQAVEILIGAIAIHGDDPNYPAASLARMRLLVAGPKAYCGGGGANGGGADAAPATITATEEDYAFDLKTEAAIYHHHSPYPEVRSVTRPGDDPTTPVETIRAYFLGMSFMAGITAVNTFFSPRQPAIDISAVVMQLLIAPCGIFLARILPDWGVTIAGTRHSLNPGPWSFKEQVFCSVIFTIANNAGNTYYVYLVQRLPQVIVLRLPFGYHIINLRPALQYLGNTWVTFSYEIVLALSVNFFGMGFAGLLRRFVIYPISCLFPEVFPALALNRALVERQPQQQGQNKKEVVHGWTISRYRFFLTCAALMFFYFWVPNTLFKALRSFNWMTWIAPQNFTLAMVTGFWGGMGYNPIATFDWNVAGKGSLTTPFFSFVQQYCARFVSGLIIIGMYWGNMYWSAYMPINSNEVFANDGKKYNVTRILDKQSNKIDVDAYREYGPPFFSGANVFGQGGWFAWYPLTLFSVSIQHWEALKRTGVEMWHGLLNYGKRSIYDSYDDPFTRLMRAYPEVPDWWFLGVLAISLSLGIVALEVWPVHVPWWSLFAVMGVSAVMLVPATLLRASANVKMDFNVLFQLLGGLWFPGNPEALIIVTAYGQNFDEQASDYITGQKMGHYAKIPPRAVFRGQMLAVFINTFVFVGMLDWMVVNFDDGTLCQWNVSNFSGFKPSRSITVRVLTLSHPPMVLSHGGVIGIGWGLARRYGPSIHAWLRRRTSEGRLVLYEKFFFTPVSYLWYFDPAVSLKGALNWTGGSNLSYATNGMYVSFIMMVSRALRDLKATTYLTPIVRNAQYYVKRHYGAWWEKYNYLIEAGFGAGIALSAIIQTFSFAFTNTDIPPWWGNEVTTAGVDYLAYNQNATLLPVPAQGFFGPPPDQYPMHL
ncbi:OPT-domain-containing protein [Apiospora kogelbergensis]|uniref:OPT-domain-containing protein n=1 Tax=Apiospora kogelbergensis TaxID=1337665 RepID=A0AAW0RC32_9PEZI